MYKNLNKQQKALHDLMSQISEEAWAAGWMEGLEYALWHIVLNGPARYGWEFISESTIKQLKQLSQQTGEWIIYDDVTKETAITLSK
ncbi:hypothetical protein [Hymenobacter sp.]|jgi:hypothetical protein|uniref:hypothetical protein n=1 Tax=Hymenobacter sp. TaxID=1898978 RepID=UPI002ED87F06